MDTLNQAVSVFLPLNDRLFYFESGDYINKAYTYVRGTNYNEFEEYKIKTLDHQITAPSMLISNVVNEAMSLNRIKETYEEATLYFERINTIIKNLKSTKKELIEYDYVVTDPNDAILNTKLKQTSKERKKQLKEMYKHELTTYMQVLDLFLKTRKLIYEKAIGTKDTFIEEKVQHVDDKPIVFDNDFLIQQYKDVFKADLSGDQAYLFIYYMIKLGIMPPYNKSEIMRLGKVFFWRHEQTIKDGIAHIDTTRETPDDLEKLRDKVLLRILHEVEKDLKVASEKSKHKRKSRVKKES